jgi:nitrate/nitrite transporter NarK
VPFNSIWAAVNGASNTRPDSAQRTRMRTMVQQGLAAGAFGMVVEGVMEELADIITTSVDIPVIGIGASAHQAWSANIFTTVSDMFPKKAVASVVGIGGMAGGLGGVVVSKIGGALFDHYKKIGHIETGYTIMFSFCAIAYLLAWILMKTLVPKYKPVDL